MRKITNPFKKRNLSKRTLKKLEKQSSKNKPLFKTPKFAKREIKKIKQIQKENPDIQITPKKMKQKNKFLKSPVGIMFLILSGIIFVMVGFFTYWEVSNTANLQDSGALIAILSDDKYRAELKSKGLLGDESITAVDGTTDKSSSKSGGDDHSSKGTNLNKFLLSSVKGYGNDVSAAKLDANLGPKSSGTDGKGSEILAYAKQKNINILAFAITSTIEGGGAGNYINHYASNTSSDALQRFKDDAVIWSGKKGDATANGGTLVGGAFDDLDTVYNYATTSGFFSKRGIHDTAFTDDWSGVASKDNLEKNAPKGSVGRYGCYQTAAMAYVAMTGKPMPKENGYPSGGPNFNSRSVIEPIANKFKK